MKKLILIAFVLIGTLKIQAQENVFEALLKTYVDKRGDVDYKGIKKGKAILEVYLNELSKTVPGDNWSSDKAKAFWMNAYNAYSIKLIIDSYPFERLTDIKRNGKNAWKLEFAEIGGKKYSLDYIQHKILRRWHSDPRVHVGINAGSKTGPKLVRFAFTEENINEKLDELMKTFINDPEKNKITANKIVVSKVFDWYKEDFTYKQSLIQYINKYSNVKANDNAKVLYREYDWVLNDQLQ